MKTPGKKRKTWREKLLDDKGFPKVHPIDATKSKRWGEGTFVIPAPIEVDELMRRVPRGRLITIDELRKVLAARHGATIACPMTTGIFAWIAANAAAEALEAGAADATPYWRTLKSKGELNPKYPGSIEGLKAKLAQEGHRIIQKGKRFFIEGFEQRLFSFEAKSPAKASGLTRNNSVEGQSSGPRAQKPVTSGISACSSSRARSFSFSPGSVS
jgi:hypothetical protein